MEIVNISELIVHSDLTAFNDVIREYGDSSNTFQNVIIGAAGALDGSLSLQEYLRGVYNSHLSGLVRIAVIAKSNEEKLIYSLVVTLYIRAGSTGFADAEICVLWAAEIEEGLVDRLLREAKFYVPWTAYNRLEVGEGKMWESMDQMKEHIDWSDAHMPPNVIKQYKSNINRSTMIPQLETLNERTRSNCFKTAEKIVFLSNFIIKSDQTALLLHCVHARATTQAKKAVREMSKGVKKLSISGKKKKKQKEVEESDVDEEEDEEEDDEGDEDEDEDEEEGEDGAKNSKASGKKKKTKKFYDHLCSVVKFGDEKKYPFESEEHVREIVEHSLRSFQCFGDEEGDVTTTIIRTIDVGEVFHEIGELVDLPPDIYCDLVAAVQVGPLIGIVPTLRYEKLSVPGSFPFSFFVNAKVTQYKSMGNCLASGDASFTFYKVGNIGDEVVIWNGHEGESRQDARKHKLLLELTNCVFVLVGYELAKMAKNKPGVSRMRKEYYEVKGMIN